ncbi:MAG: CHASE4 domain-containing protein [Ignavibacteriaceae bacterium]|nr:CHASE4 domain-containing protein [Ignavibacteriaceae bacterium]
MKVLIIMSISFFVLLSTLFYVSNLNIVKNIKQQENNELENSIELVHDLIQEKIDSLNRTTEDWAPWDDMYNFVKKPNQDFIDSNLDPSTASNLQLNLLAIVVNDKILVLKAYDYTTKQNIEETNIVEKDLKRYITRLKNGDNINDLKSGVITINNQPMLISIRPITDSARKAPEAGMLIMGRYLDRNVTDSIEKLTKGTLTVAEVKEYKGTLGDNFKLTNITPLNNNEIEINYYMNDLFFNKSFNIEFRSNRNSYNQGWQYLKFFIIFFIVSLLIVSIVCNELLKRFIIKPLEKINSAVNIIDINNMLDMRVDEKGNDEFTILSKGINSMLDRIDRANKRVIESENQLKVVIDAASAGFWDWDIKNDKLNLNYRTMEMLGYGNEDKITSIDAWKNLIHKEDKMYSINTVNSSIVNISNTILLEHRLLTKDSGYKWFLIQGKTIEKIDGDSARVTGIITDLTDKKLSEEELKYLTYYDTLTGLFNRGYYETISNNLNTKAKLPVTIIVADVNGLKIINDTFGHAAGDKLLIEISKILRKACGENAIISRLGGDEFSIIIEGSNENIVKDIFETIKNLCNETQVNSLTISVALGYSTKHNETEDIHEIAKMAEERMYRNKLLEKRSSRNSTISSLSKMLFEKSYETEEHAIRMFKICEKIGKKISVTSAQLDELNLLAKLHDIGKVAIPDNILNKPGKLTEDEFEIMKTHTQIGYRIAIELVDLRHIAYDILCHHENFDGSGYPNALKDNAIPFLARIMRIVDSFDVMVSGRPYKLPMTRQDAIDELLKYSGKYYDPELVRLFIEVNKELE